MDIVDKQSRSWMMAGIRSSNTKPEVLARKALHNLGYRYKLGGKICKIKPDIVLRRHKVAVFAHGCYWHKHEGCKLAYSDRKYSVEWESKFEANLKRDQRVLKQLTAEGWRVVVIWECVTRNSVEFEKVIRQVNKFILSGTPEYFESKYHAL